MEENKKLNMHTFNMLGRMFKTTILHEVNSCADGLVNMGYEHAPGLRVYEQCPTRLSPLVLADVMGIATPRVIYV